MQPVQNQPSATSNCRRVHYRRAAMCSALAATALVLLAVHPAQRSPTSPASSEATPVEHWNGFIDDASCASCHQDIADSFSTHSMARAFAHPSRAKWVETFAEGDTLSYEERGTRYQLLRSGDELHYRRWQVASDGEPIHLWEQTVDWVLGSGSNSRVYLVQSAEGALYELPIAWYSQTSEFAPTPGTNDVEREGRLRVIRRPCLFCHNAVPTDPIFDDHRFAPEHFPHELPEGIGCQRCHGPGLQHVETARNVAANRPATAQERREARDQVRATVTNPARLEPGLRRDVCAQCHHQPAVALFGQRRLDRSDYEFAAGEELRDFLLKLDVLEAHGNGGARPKKDRFEINHHAYRLEQSACFLESPAGSLECTSCHDPHRDQPATVTFERAREQCLACHVDATPVAPEAAAIDAEHFAATECVTCHMPRRRTEDIVRVVMTDHLIQRRPEPESERLAPIEEEQADVLDVFVLDPDPAAPLTEDLMRAMSGVRAGSLQLSEDLARLIAAARRHQPQLDLREPEMRLANALVRLGRDSEAIAILDRLRLDPDYQLVATELAAIARARTGNRDAALELLDQVIEDLDEPSGHLLFNRGAIRLGAGHPQACADLQRATERNQFLRRAWTYLGRCRDTEGDPDAAIEAYQQALRLDPSETRTALLLTDLLRRVDRQAEADRIENHSKQQSAN